MSRICARRPRFASLTRKRVAWIVACWALWLPVSFAAQEAEAPVAETARDVLPDLLALQEGTLPEGVPVTSLFAVRLDVLAEVQQRGTALQTELATIDAQIAARRAREPIPVEGEAAPLADAPDPALAALELRREVAHARVTYLKGLAERLGAMSEAARRILPGIAEPRAALRQRAAATSAVADALEELTGRVEGLALRLSSGALVGFRAEAREQAKTLGNLAEALTVRSERLRAVAEDERQLAARFESEGRELRRTFFVTLLSPEREAQMDALFLPHLAEQRRLQRRVDRDVAGIDRVELESLAVAIVGALPQPGQVGTVALATRIAESLGEFVARADAAIEASRNAREGWRLAFENEVVTVLSGQISATTRREAYAFSQSLLPDLEAEVALAWERVADSLQDFWPRSENGVGWVMRLAAILVLIGAWWTLRHYTAVIVTTAVRALARVARGRFGLRVGTLVRLSGLLQSVLPALVAFPALWGVAWILGGTTLAAQLLRTVGLPFLWYALGLQLLIGLTTRITWGRPALIEVTPAKLPRLRLTYARLGLIVAGAAALDGLARSIIGEGVVVLLIDALAITWVAVWAAWEAVEWRASLAEWWQGMLPEEPASVERRCADWMARSRLGFVLSPFVVARGFLRWLVGFVGARTNISALLAARRVRRAAEADATPPTGEGVPEDYLREFPLRPILGGDDALLLPRDETVKEILAQIEHWREAKSQGSIALVGEKGSGKTTLAALVARGVAEPEVVQHTLQGKPADGEALFRDLSQSLPANGASNLEEWIEGLNVGPERVVLIDEAHNVFLRTVGGYRAYDALIDVVNATSSRIFWIILFNSFTWRFLNESRSRLHFFRKLIEVPSWSSDELRDLIRRRNKQTGFDVEFDEMLLTGERGSEGLELVEGADGYFRLLRETSGGNPRIATRLWLSSLTVVGEKKLRVSAFREPSSTALGKMSDELLFALAAIAQHENLSTDELRRVLNVSEGIARFAMRYLVEAELIVGKEESPDRFTLAAGLYRQTLRALRQKHLLFE